MIFIAMILSKHTIPESVECRHLSVERISTLRIFHARPAVAICLLIYASMIGFSHAAEEDPNLEFAMGVHERFHGNSDLAAGHFESARLIAPTAAPLVEMGAERLLAMGDRAGAVKLYQDLAAARPEDLVVQLLFADFITSLDKDDALACKLASECLETALLKHPGHLQIIRRLVPLYQAKGGKEAVVALLDTLPWDDPAAAMLYVSVFRPLHDKEDLSARDVIDQRFEVALEAAPGDALLARTASDYFRDTDRQAKAIEVLQKHTAASPWSLDLRVRLGVLHFASKQGAQGEVLLKEVLSIHPRRAMAHQALAKYYRKQELPEKATYHARELLKIRGGDVEEFLRLADECLAAGDPREARLLLERAVFDQPDNATLAMKLAIATYRDPETRSRATRMFREAEAVAPDGKITDPAFLIESAGALIESGQSRAAEERLRAAIRAYPPDAKKETATALRRLAGLWTAENRNADAARALIQRADSLDPP